MISASPELIQLLNTSTKFFMADLYTFILKNGAILRYTSADIDITNNGVTFDSNGLFIERGKITIIAGLEVDELNLTVYGSTTDIITNGLTFPQMLTKGLFDNASFLLERVFMSDWTSPPVESIIRFLGRVSDIDFSRSQADMTITSMLELLDIKMPRNLVQVSCIRTLYDGGCKLNKAAWGTSSTVQPGSTQGNIISGIITKPDGYYDLGVITFSTGQNEGISRTVRTHSANGTITPIVPFPNPLTIGDFFTVYPGCDRTMNTCKNKFNNLQNFRGCPFIPTLESVL